MPFYVDFFKYVQGVETLKKSMKIQRILRHQQIPFVSAFSRSLEASVTGEEDPGFTLAEQSETSDNLCRCYSLHLIPRKPVLIEYPRATNCCRHNILIELTVLKSLEAQAKFQAQEQQLPDFLGYDLTHLEEKSKAETLEAFRDSRLAKLFS